MSHELLLLRHAKSAWDTDAETDFDRPLAKRGRKAAPRIGNWLKSNHLTPDRIISSPAERARQTAVAVAKVLEITRDAIAWQRDIYDAELETLLSLVRALPESCHRVMLVGHNPGLEELLEWFCGDESAGLDSVKVLPTAAVAVIAIDCAWVNVKPARANLVELVRPRELKVR